MNNEVHILIDALNKKQEILDEILNATKEQLILVSESAPDYDSFDLLVEKKSELLEAMAKVDTGFDSIFKGIKDELIEYKADYADEIRKIQDLIKKNMDTGSDIHMTEAKVKECLSAAFTNEKRRLSKEKADGSAVMRYYQQANQNSFIEPAFLDQKK